MKATEQTNENTEKQNIESKETIENIEYEKVLKYHKMISALLFAIPLSIIVIETSSNNAIDPTSFSWISIIVGTLIEISTCCLLFLCINIRQVEYYGKTISINLINLVPILISLLILESINKLYYLYLNGLLTPDRLNLELFSKGGMIYIIPTIIMIYVIFKVLKIQDIK